LPKKKYSTRKIAGRYGGRKKKSLGVISRCSPRGKSEKKKKKGEIKKREDAKVKRWRGEEGGKYSSEKGRSIA